MNYLPVHLYKSIKKLQDVHDFLTVHYDTRDVSISKMKRLIDVSVKRIQDLNRISPDAAAVIDAMDPTNMVHLSVHLYNLQSYLCT